MTMKINTSSFAFEKKALYVFYLFFSLLKINAQIQVNFGFQCLFVLLSNVILIFPFFNQFEFKKFEHIFKFFVFITLGEIFIVFFENPFLIKFGMLFYLLAKISLLVIFNRSRIDYNFKSILNFLYLFIPIFLGFFLCFFLFNTSSVDLLTAVMIITYSAVATYLFTYIFFFKKFEGKEFVIIGLLLSCFHDILGGFNFFHSIIDKNFIVSYVLIFIGNLSLFYGLWKYNMEFNSELD